MMNKILSTKSVISPAFWKDLDFYSTESPSNTLLKLLHKHHIICAWPCITLLKSEKKVHRLEVQRESDNSSGFFLGGGWEPYLICVKCPHNRHSVLFR